MLDIRTSMIPTSRDCMRLAAAKQWPELIESKGFELRRLKVSIGAAVGTGFHKGAAHILNQQREAGAEAAAIEAFNIELERTNGAEFDPTTPSRTTAQEQIRRLLKTWLPIARTTEPTHVEVYLTAPVGDGFRLTGHLDVREVKRDSLEPRYNIRDHKTGSKMPSPQAQLGGYALLSQQGYITDEETERIIAPANLQVDGVGMDYMQRVKLDATQPEPVRREFEIYHAEKAAYAAVEAIKRDVQKFRDTGDEYAFDANPSSFLCSPKYCNAHGTSFCAFGKPSNNR